MQKIDHKHDVNSTKHILIFDHIFSIQRLVPVLGFPLPGDKLLAATISANSSPDLT